ncbi:hypothetical protein DIURU_005446 [Diutina rugosa]|uniref:Uncharacterized protein n=1 Tax=Diutina rugosa TaxID=5481 RepID=A0A642UD22_DIURU|nr:uncharacterized protein DIURU_005446 [Diutina rugosa]KAA8896933.1 hypothetical protein DIURU_005446 [Diutina rugosa]
MDSTQSRSSTSSAHNVRRRSPSTVSEASTVEHPDPPPPGPGQRQSETVEQASHERLHVPPMQSVLMNSTRESRQQWQSQFRAHVVNARLYLSQLAQNIETLASSQSNQQQIQEYQLEPDLPQPYVSAPPNSFPQSTASAAPQQFQQQQQQQPRHQQFYGNYYSGVYPNQPPTNGPQYLGPAAPTAPDQPNHDQPSYRIGERSQQSIERAQHILVDDPQSSVGEIILEASQRNLMLGQFISGRFRDTFKIMQQILSDMEGSSSSPTMSRAPFQNSPSRNAETARYNRPPRAQPHEQPRKAILHRCPWKPLGHCSYQGSDNLNKAKVHMIKEHFIMDSQPISRSITVLEQLTGRCWCSHFKGTAGDWLKTHVLVPNSLCPWVRVAHRWSDKPMKCKFRALNVHDECKTTLNRFADLIKHTLEYHFDYDNGFVPPENDLELWLTRNGKCKCGYWGTGNDIMCSHIMLTDLMCI